MVVLALDKGDGGRGENLSANEAERLNLEDAIGAIWSSISRSKSLPINVAGTADREIQCLAIPLRNRENLEEDTGNLFLYRLGSEQEVKDDESGPLTFGTGVIRIRFNADTDGVRDLRYRYGHGTTMPDEPDQTPWLSEAPLEDLRRLVELNPGEALDIVLESADTSKPELEICREWSANYRKWIKSLIDEKMRSPRI